MLEFKERLFRLKYQQSSLPTKRQGFIGLYHPFKGRVYSGTGINEDEDLYKAYLFGENAILSRLEYGNYSFKEDIEKHCLEFNVNRVHGILLPPSEGGVVNNPSDNKLLEPAHPPGMIQGAARFSELAKIYPQIYGIIVDDFWANYGNAIKYEDIKNIKGALLGKKVDNNGRVDHSSPITTPHLKLFIVSYDGEKGSSSRDLFELIDGVNFWIYDQESQYGQFGNRFNFIRSNYPGKELILGIYIHNSDFGDMSKQSISYLLQKGIELYEQRQISGILLFAGHWLVKNYISRERSSKIGLSDFLYKYFYPYLGDMKCRILDDGTKKPLEKVSVKVVSGDRTVAQGATNVQGDFDFSGWSGRSGGFEYRFLAEKVGYEPYSGSFILKPNTISELATVYLNPLRMRKNLDSKAVTYEESRSFTAVRTDNVDNSGKIGDRMFPYCIAFPLEISHYWHYPETRILEVLSTVRFSYGQPDLYDNDDKALRCISELKKKLEACPCGIALGYMRDPVSWQAVVIYWIDPLTWKFWDPNSRSLVAFSCKYVIG
ncbi:MAG: hypothetical protein MUO26_08810 [Methanotrichaceae archaeon]|nr:hypothetical protein [Methanotrichaceae archaeon]